MRLRASTQVRHVQFAAAATASGRRKGSPLCASKLEKPEYPYRNAFQMVDLEDIDRYKMVQLYTIIEVS